ncbi:MAG: acyltransferase domain-containing protein [Kineosporiaceae bacterium]
MPVRTSPSPPRGGAGPARSRARLLAWSGAGVEQAEESRRHLARLLRARGEPGFADLAGAWSAGGHGPVRYAVVADGAAQALAALATFDDVPPAPGWEDGRGEPAVVLPDPRSVALLLPGQGTQQPRMAHGLTTEVAAAGAVVEEVWDLLGADGDRWRRSWLAGDPGFARDDGGGAMALLFAVDVAVARLLLAWGLRPAALLGQGVGELAALHLAGVLDLPDAVAVLHEYALAVAQLPPQGMIAACAPGAAMLPQLPEGVHLACDNGPSQVLVAGPLPALAVAEDRFDAAGWAVMPVRAGAAYHTPWMAPAAHALGAALAGVTRRAPATTLVGSVAARPLTAEEAADPAFWAACGTAPVRMWDALGALASACPPGTPWVEVGRGSGLATLARRHPRRHGRPPVLSMLSVGPTTGHDDGWRLLEAAAACWTAGMDVDLAAVEESFG